MMGLRFEKDRFITLRPETRIANASTRASPRQVARVYTVSKIQTYITPGGPCISEKLWMKRFREISFVLCVFESRQISRGFWYSLGSMSGAFTFQVTSSFFDAGRHPLVNLERLLCKAGRNHSSTRSYRFYTNFVPLLHPKIQDYTANYTLWYWSDLINWFDTGFWFHLHLILILT